MNIISRLSIANYKIKSFNSNVNCVLKVSCSNFVKRLIKQSKSDKPLHKIKQAILKKLEKDNIINPVTKELIVIPEKNKEIIESNNTIVEPIVRLNRCLRPLTRKLADEAIVAGKVYVNDVKATIGMRITRNDKVMLEGFGEVNTITPAFGHILHPLQILNKTDLLFEKKKITDYLYIKIWKPSGMICSASRKEKHSLFNLLVSDTSKSLPIGRLHCIGNLDKDTSGIVLITNDGRLRNAITNLKIPIETKLMIKVEKKNSLPQKINQLPKNENENNESMREIVQAINDINNFSEPEKIISKSKNIPLIIKESPNQYAVTKIDHGKGLLIDDLKRELLPSIRKEKLSSIERIALGDITLDRLTAPGSSDRLNKTEMKYIHKLLKDSKIKRNEVKNKVPNRNTLKRKSLAKKVITK